MHDGCGTGLGDRLEAEAGRVAPPRPDFEKLFDGSIQDPGIRHQGILDPELPVHLSSAVGQGRGREVRLDRRDRRVLPTFIPYALAACLALGLGFALGRFVLRTQSSPSEDLLSTISDYSGPSEVQNEVRLYLDELWKSEAGLYLRSSQ